MGESDTVDKLLIQAELVHIIRELTLLAYDDPKELQSLLTRIEKRLEHYKNHKITT